jgi:mannosyl-oligosaccharide alpha-1,2-mannosidase
MIALGAHSDPKLAESAKSELMDLAGAVTSTCHESYDRTATKLGPESFRFDGANDATNAGSNDVYYILR